MRIFKALFLVTATVMIFGCATPLTIQSDGEYVASKIGVEHEDICFLSYSTFRDSRKKSLRPWPYVPGISILTPKNFYIIKGKSDWGVNVDKISTNKMVVIPIAELTGIEMIKGGFRNQLRLYDDDRLIILNILCNKALVDNDETERLYDLFLISGVPNGGVYPYW